MRMLIIGGSGRTGKLVIDSLLQQGHTATALVRNAQSLPPRTGLKVVAGTPTSTIDIREAMLAVEGEIPQAVIVTLNAVRASDSPFAKSLSPPRFMADSNANVIAVMKEFGVSKIVIMQAFGVGESERNMSIALRLLVNHSNMSLQYDDHNLVDQEVRASGITYVLVRPLRLAEGGAKEVKEWKNNGKGVGLMANISRESVANWLVKAAVENTWDNTCPVITN